MRQNPPVNQLARHEHTSHNRNFESSEKFMALCGFDASRDVILVVNSDGARKSRGAPSIIVLVLVLVSPVPTGTQEDKSSLSCAFVYSSSYL